MREVELVITLRSGKEVDLPTSKPEHELETEAEKEKKEEIKGKRKENSTKKEDLEAKCKSLVKYKDPGCPTISVMIGETCLEKALLDLGASVNLLPYSVYNQLGLGELKPTSITLSLADRSMKIPRGMIEDVLVQVDQFYYPMDFVVLDMDSVAKGTNCIPIILGRPFLATSNAIINCMNEEETQEAIKEEPPKLILKPLPMELKYAYLEENKQSPIVTSSSLTTTQEDCLLEILRRCKKAIEWKISDLKGISL
ncbi:hypothetical protein CK203_056227 [Vitis vinifera]|uniref:Uncharacterized protein n=1 Tax=Vitis vinifera TaxID=29760 RepID=A0A438GJI7_VITVI|nr:hypothetical protein CK203_056227 [Vitis vinifera]